MPTEKTYHILPAPGGEWLIRSDDDPSVSDVEPTQDLAVARVWKRNQGRDAAEVIVHDASGTARTSLSIRPIAENGTTGTFAELDDEADEALRREAERITPRRAELRAMIGRLPTPAINYDEDDELPC